LGVTTRLITPADVPAVTALLAANRDFIAPWDPVRPDRYYTEDGQREVIGTALEAYGREAARRNGCWSATVSSASDWHRDT
jgi:ribosomal-protein-alanine N-acetyltransferase